MFAFQRRPSPRRLGVVCKSNIARSGIFQCACEAVEPRLLLSTANFAAPTSLSVPGARAPLVAGRFDGSANPNGIAVATATAVQILTGSSTGTFTLGSSIPLPANPAAINPFQEGNFSGSGTEDIVLDSFNSSTGSGEITYETNDGTGHFTAGPVTNITDGGAGFTPIAGKSGDFNGDGESDLAIVGKPGSGNGLVLAVLLSNGNGTFTEADYPITGSNANLNTSNEEVFTDFSNNDEIVVYDGSGGNLDVFSGAGDGTFTQLTPMPLAANLLVGGTFNNNQDLIVADGDNISVLVNQGDGTFQPDPQGPIALPGPINALAVGDFDLDGNNDIITNQGILFGNGDETFNSTPQALPAALDGGNNVSNTLQAVFLGHNKQGFVGFGASGNTVVTAVNTTLPAVAIDLESTNNPANPGSDVQFTATVSAPDINFTATPTGSVTFFNGTTNLGTEALSSGTATFDAGSSLSGADNSITAVYSGDSTFAAGTSTPLVQTVLANTATTLTSSENPSFAGDDVIFTAVVTGNDGAGDVPTGNVEFFDNGNDLGGGSLDSTGTATCDTTGTLAVGSHSITAQYQADSNFAASVSSALTQTVNQPSLVPAVAATTLPAMIVAGSKVHGTITITLDNQTSSPLSADQVTVFASSNGDISGATPLVSKSSKHGIAIAGGQTKKLRFAVKFPTNLGEAAYTLLVQVTSSLGQTSNSSGGPSINVAAPYVDLAGATGTGIVKPNLAKIGKSVSLTIDLTNSGNIPSSSLSLDVGLSTDGQTEADDIEMPTAHLVVKPNHTGVLRLHFKIPSTVLPGMYEPYISVTADGTTETVIGQTFTVEA